MTDAPFEILDENQFSTATLKSIRTELARTSDALEQESLKIMQRIKSEIIFLNGELETRQLNFIKEQQAERSRQSIEILEQETQHNQKQQEEQLNFELEQQNAQNQFDQLQRNAQSQFDQEQREKRNEFEQELLKKQQEFSNTIRDRNLNNKAAFSEAIELAKQAQIIANANPADRNKLIQEFQQQNQLEDRIENAVKKFSLANIDLNSDQILKLAQKASGSNLTQNPKAVATAIEKIEEEQKRQQRIADQKARLEFEQKLQQEESKFRENLRTEELEFKNKLAADEQALKQLLRQGEIEFRAAQKADDIIFQSILTQQKEAFNLKERILEQIFQQSLMAEEAAFKKTQRALDKQSGEEIARILKEARQKAEIQDQQDMKENNISEEERNKRDQESIDDFAKAQNETMEKAYSDPKFWNKIIDKLMRGIEEDDKKIPTKTPMQKQSSNTEEYRLNGIKNQAQTINLDTTNIGNKLDTLISQNKDLASQILAIANRPRTITTNNLIASEPQSRSVLGPVRL